MNVIAPKTISHFSTTEAEYQTWLEFTQRLSDEQNIDLEPTKTLFWLACEYLRRWEAVHDPWASVLMS